MGRVSKQLIRDALQFWERPETAEHVFETITPTDIRNMRDNQFVNLETLILETCRHLIHLRWSSHSLSDRDAGAGKEVLNCIRILTRVLPFIYESDDLRDWERAFFWEEGKHQSGERRPSATISGGPRSAESIATTTNTATTNQSDPQPTGPKCLGLDLVDTLLDLSFWAGFTLPINPDGPNGPTYGFWQSGIAYERRLDTSKEFESRRTEIMQLLLTLESKSIYMNTGTLGTTVCHFHTSSCTNLPNSRLFSVRKRGYDIYFQSSRSQESPVSPVLPSQHGTAASIILPSFSLIISRS